MTETHYAVLIRHGDYHQRSGVPSARQPFPLTETGRAQARACADNLAEMLQKAGLSSPPLLYCSRQLRAWETASLIAERLEALGLGRPEIQQSSDLAERGLGSAANLTAAEIETILREDPRYDPAPKGWKSDSDYRLPLEGAESLMEA
ncbi:MAG: histidine phosphatase family protein, partial [Mangrovicoccus sp.]